MPPSNTEPPLWHALVSGSFGGGCSVAVAYPFDTMKVWQQVGKPGQGMLQSLHGVRLGTLYSGVAAQLHGVIPFWATFYFGYRLGRRYFPDETSTRHAFLAGAVAGAVATPAVVMAETVKTLAQADRTSSSAALRRMASSGVRIGLWRVVAVTPFTLAYMMPSQGLFFASYELAARHLGGSEGLAGGVAGLCEWTASLPADTVRARLYVEVLTKAERAAPIACARRLWEAEGLSGFYRGLTPALLRAFAANAAALGGIDVANRLLKQYSDRAVA